MRAMRTHTPTPDTLPDNVALRLFRLQDAVLHSAYGGWWAQGHDQYILPPLRREPDVHSSTQNSHPTSTGQPLTRQSRSPHP